VDVKLIAPFIDALFEVLPALGFTDVKRGKLSIRENLAATTDVTTLVGLSDDVRGNVIYCMSEDTAKNIASVMMMGMPVEQFDEIAQSAISELANMVTANASTKYSSQGLFVNVCPPSLITGENVTVMVSQVKTLSVEVLTEAGTVEVNVGLEV